MATSGTWIWNPDLAEITDEAFERARVDPALLTFRHIESARRSMRFMLADWEADEHHEFRIVEGSFLVTDGTSQYTGGTDFDATNDNLIEVVRMALRRSGADTPISIISRDEYLDIPDKTTEGRPDRCFVDKQRDALVLTFWPVPENSTDTVIYHAVRKFEDSDTAADNADISDFMYEAFAAGLAARLAEKFSPPELEQALWAKARNALEKATKAQRSMKDVRIIPQHGSGRRRRSHR